MSFSEPPGSDWMDFFSSALPVKPSSSVLPNQGSRQMKGPLGFAHTASIGKPAQCIVTNGFLSGVAIPTVST